MRKLFKFTAFVLLALVLAQAARHRFQPISPIVSELSALRDAPGPVRADDGGSALDQLKVVSPSDTNVSPAPDAQAVQVESIASSQPDVRVLSRWFPDFSSDLQPVCFNDEYVEDASNTLEFHAMTHLPYVPSPPASKFEEVQWMVRRLGAARSYEEALLLEKRYLRVIGAIQHFHVLKLIHSSDVSPDVIAKDGLWSADEIGRVNGTPFIGHGTRLGSDGIYFFRERDLHPKAAEFTRYGKYHYLVEVRDVDFVMQGPYSNGSSFQLYMDDIVHSMWGKDVPARVGTSLSGYAYSDLDLDGVIWLMPCDSSDLTQIFLHRSKIDPSQITVLP